MFPQKDHYYVSPFAPFPLQKLHHYYELIRLPNIYLTFSVLLLFVILVLLQETLGSPQLIKQSLCETWLALLTPWKFEYSYHNNYSNIAFCNKYHICLSVYHKISRLNCLLTLFPFCLRFTHNITIISTRLATSWLVRPWLGKISTC